ncbi:MAG: dissimilatory-type sulfite reductase subunit alpha [Rhodospirillaceae bacterium]|nr:dissimilatory-type sulfite reductase subunit alpha [Rhodospirillaceae bacterium]MBT3883936.1 dissimilatory-type sulfite reductase subunit alpha [Rhodospirillaceae bacterium]MBT4117718.1 dissimilatory-type sulfite reductase subunit alpha [Rhodospirillaceae bacterium]MBT4674475.1 dissimilatory-type sulfite reductase subunit alpha [Rhodospirillaceae bacterium]MBT4721217.1 dissimilatory-type sulfite reductase subunit alpha [Rhodospirillaceae bacterium]
MKPKKHKTPLLDELQDGKWPSFVNGLKRLADDDGKSYSPMMNDLLGQLEHSYQTKLGYWKGGTVSVFGYGGGVIPRFSKVAEEFPESSEFHTLRVQPPAGLHYSTDLLRNMCDIWEEHGSGLIALHGQSGDIMFQGCTTENVQKAFDDLNEIGLDMGGAGPALRTSMSCVGHARCEQSCYDEVRAHRSIINAFLDEMHRPALPYKFKFKFSGCANDCVNAIHRADFAVIGTWRDDMKVDQAEVKNYIDQAGRKYTIDNVIARCPTNALSLNDDDTLEVDNSSCVRCMHCLNVMNKALSPGDDKGVTILIGGKRSLKIGDQMGTVVVPFLKLESDEDFERLEEIAENVIEFFAENALEHERIGETIDRIGLVNFLDGVGVEIDPNMVNHPRTNSYVDTAEWDQEADKWLERKAGEAAE